MSLLCTLLATGLVSAGPVVHAAAPAPLHLEVYNPGTRDISPVSPEIISGAHKAILTDVQFQRSDTEALAQKLKASGKTLITVYISQSDPDYYSGLDVIRAAFPRAEIVATPQTVAAIKASMDSKLAYWSPILKDNVPRTLVLPDVLSADHLTLEGRTIEIKELNGSDAARTYLWIPSIKTVTGGVVVNSGNRVWMTDMQTRESHLRWLQTLDNIMTLKPTTVVSGHFTGAMPEGPEAVRFTADYPKAFELQAAKTGNSAELIKAMKTAYPALGGDASLELNAKVIKGEVKWPQ